MSRVLLFVQTGDARPKVVPCGARNEAAARLAAAVIGAKFDRWWLVECENAEAGRFMIDPKWTNGRCSWPPPQGRILASGGKR